MRLLIVPCGLLVLRGRPLRAQAARRVLAREGGGEVCTSVLFDLGTAVAQFLAPPRLARLPYVTFYSMCRTRFPHFSYTYSCFGHSYSGAARNLATQVHNECDGEIVCTSLPPTYSVLPPPLDHARCLQLRTWHCRRNTHVVRYHVLIAPAKWYCLRQLCDAAPVSSAAVSAVSATGTGEPAELRWVGEDRSNPSGATGSRLVRFPRQACSIIKALPTNMRTGTSE